MHFPVLHFDDDIFLGVPVPVAIAPLFIFDAHILHRFRIEPLSSSQRTDAAENNSFRLTNPNFCPTA